MTFPRFTPIGTRFIYEIDAFDRVGNIRNYLESDGTLAQFGLPALPNRDATAPSTTITGGPSGVITASTAAFTWSGSDNLTPVGDLVYAYRLDPLAPTFSAYGSATTSAYTGLANGTYSFVKAKDQAGNVTSPSASRSFTVLKSVGGGSLAVTAPNGGETWPIGSSQSVQWTAAGLTGNVKIEVSRNAGTSWVAITTSTPNDGAFSWTVTGPATTQARLRVTSLTDPTAADASNLSFTIGGGSLAVTTPNGGETWPIGSTQSIQWTSAGLTGNVKIEVSRYGGTSWVLINRSTVNSGTFNWTVTGPATTQARIRIASLTDPTVADACNANFTIQ